jgi:MFS family permease
MSDAARNESVLDRFLVLRTAVPELWITFALKLIVNLAYKVMNMTLVLWLSRDLGFDDVHAGYIVTGWAAAMTLFTVAVGSLTDAIGLRRSFFLGVAICCVARFVMTFFAAKWMVIVGGMLPLALGEALCTPVLIAAVRRYSTTAQRSISFSLLYVMMNVGFFAASWLFDLVRGRMGEHGQFVIPLVGHGLTTYQTLFFVSLLVEIVLVPIVYFGMREGVEVTDEGVRVVPYEMKRVAGDSLARSVWVACREALRESGAIFAGLWKQPGFYKFLAFLGFASCMRLIMLHMDFTYPKFGIRELGEGAPIGKLWGINSLLIIVFVPLVGAFTQKVPAYRMAMVGTAIGAASVFIMTLPLAWFQPLAEGLPGRLIGNGYLGLHGVPHPYYMMIFLFVVMLSVGEAIYSPRLYEYAASIAPRGQEASYMSISYLPYFVAKLIVSAASGHLLEAYCPEHGPRDSHMLWLIIALCTMIAPIGLISLQRFIRVKEEGRDE